MAESLISAFPILKSNSGTGFVSGTLCNLSADCNHFSVLLASVGIHLTVQETALRKRFHTLTEVQPLL
jgi:hypothetical protein